MTTINFEQFVISFKKRFSQYVCACEVLTKRVFFRLAVYLKLSKY